MTYNIGAMTPEQRARFDATTYSAWLRTQGVNRGDTTLSPKPLCK